MLIHLLNEASRTHVGPDLVDMVQTDLAAGRLMDGAPSGRYSKEGRPERILALLIDQYSKRAIFVIKRVSHIFNC